MKNDDSALGAAITRGFTAGKPAGECPALEVIAELVDGSLTGAERDAVMGHLALCADCRELFVASAGLAGEEPVLEKRRNYLLPSAFAAAAVLVMALTLQLAPSSSDKGMVADNSPSAAPRVALSKPAAVQPKRAVGGGAVAASKEAPVASAGKLAVAKRGPAPGGDRLASLLVRTGDPKRLSPLIGAHDKTFGFAGKGDARSLAFRIGVNLMDLQVALLTDDGDRAQAQAARLGPLLELLAGSPDTAGLERMVARLEQGEKPAAMAGKSGKLEQLVPREQVAYARLGAWAEGARLAARTGNREYLAAGVPRYFGNRLADEAVPVPAAAALRELEQALKKPRSLDFETVGKGVEELLGAF